MLSVDSISPQEGEPPRTWRNVGFLGKGGYAAVYLGECEKPNGEIKQFAVKTAISSRNASSIAKEYRIYEALNECQEITRCYSIEAGLEQGCRFYNIFLEYASAGTLKSLIKKTGGDGLPEKTVRAFTRMILKGLDHMHERGYVHCDLKPDNVLAFRTDDKDRYNLKLADFGVTKEPGEIASKDWRRKFRGAPTYMSPESVGQEVIVPALDIWSLGCTVVSMITGKRPWFHRLEFEKMEFEEVLERPGSTPIVAPEKLSGEGKDFLSKCFDRNYRTRWSAKMLLDHPFVSMD